MPQNLTERLDFKTDFYASGCKSVTQNMKMDILDSAFSAVFFMRFCNILGSIKCEVPANKNESGSACITLVLQSSKAVFVRGTTLADVSLFGFVKMIFVYYNQREKYFLL